MSPIKFPTNAEDLSPELMTSALSECYPGVVVEQLRVIDTAHVNTGSASTAARVILGLDYASGCDLGLPRRVLLKTLLIRPGAPPEMYENEVRFYKYLRPEIDMETPQVYASVFDPESGQFGVVMEDLTLRSAHFPNATISMTREQITYLLDSLAMLHARFWRSVRFSTDLRWLWTPCSGGFYWHLKNVLPEFIRFHMNRSRYKQELLQDRLHRSLDQLWEDFWKVQKILDSEPYTLLHGDTHLGNTYLLPDGKVGLLDWQLMQRGRWSHDITYILITSLDTEFRRKHEGDLIAHYLDELRTHGVEDVPAMRDAWLLYRQTAIWGFLIGWFCVPIENYGEEILYANLDRLATALEDLETFEAIS